MSMIVLTQIEMIIRQLTDANFPDGSGQAISRMYGIKKKFMYV
jgi:hypothetical protein